MKTFYKTTLLALVFLLTACQMGKPQAEVHIPEDLTIEPKHLTSAELKSIAEAEAERQEEEFLYDETPIVSSDGGANIGQIADEDDLQVFQEIAYEALEIPENFSFNTCDTRWQLSGEAWYESFRDKLVSMTNSDETNIAMICVSNDENLIIAMLNGNILDTGGVVRYQVDRNILSKAELTKDVSLHLHRFKGRVGTTIPMLGGLRDDECFYRYRLNYEFAQNTLKPLEECKECGGAAEVCTKLY